MNPSTPNPLPPAPHSGQSEHTPVRTAYNREIESRLLPTPGPWSAKPEHMERVSRNLWLCPVYSGGCCVAMGRGTTENQAIVNAEHIAAWSPSSPLLARNAALEQALKELVEAEEASREEFTAKEIDRIEAALDKARITLTP